MAFNELNSVGQTIILMLSGVDLNTADPSSPLLKEDDSVYGSFPWKAHAVGFHRP